MCLTTSAGTGAAPRLRAIPMRPRHGAAVHRQGGSGTSRPWRRMTRFRVVETLAARRVEPRGTGAGMQRQRQQREDDERLLLELSGEVKSAPSPGYSLV